MTSVGRDLLKFQASSFNDETDPSIVSQLQHNPHLGEELLIGFSTLLPSLYSSSRAEKELLRALVIDATTVTLPVFRWLAFRKESRARISNSLSLGLERLFSGDSAFYDLIFYSSILISVYQGSRRVHCCSAGWNARVSPSKEVLRKVLSVEEKGEEKRPESLRQLTHTKKRGENRTELL